MLRRVIECVKINGNGSLNIEIAKYALGTLNVDAHGLDEMDNKIPLFTNTSNLPSFSRI